MKVILAVYDEVELDHKEEEYEHESITAFRKAVYEAGKMLDELNERKKPVLTDSDKEALEKVPDKYEWLACDKNGYVYAYGNKPERDAGLEVWHNADDVLLYIVNKNVLPSLFAWCSWEDEPWYIPVLLE